VKITAVKVQLVGVRDTRAFAIAGVPQDRLWPATTLTVQTDQGLRGIGVAFTLGSLGRTLFNLTEELAGAIVGEDPTRIEWIQHKLRSGIGVEIDTGLFHLGLAAIDMALWDIRGKMAGLPLWRLLGGLRSEVPAYASGTLGRELPDKELARAAERTVAAGFGSIKMHLGFGEGSTPRREVERVRIVREAVGDDIRLGCDINERWRVDQAIDIGKRLERFGLAWIEDPVDHGDIGGLARISAALPTPIMAGERLFHLPQFRTLLERQAIGILMIDVMMAGGLSAWLKIAAVAESFNIPVVSHLLPEVQVHLVASVPNGLMAEHKSWLWDLFEEVPALQGGSYRLSERPGLGLAFNRSLVEHA
jgi:L-alanine-DL-glutamate epimerase-like enolase superfamily enzyme